jgi:hypothetical protein
VPKDEQQAQVGELPDIALSNGRKLAVSQQRPAL